MATIYRRQSGNDAWHHCSNCGNWFTADCDEQDAKPTKGELCDECLPKQDTSNCA